MHYAGCNSQPIYNLIKRTVSLILQNPRMPTGHRNKITKQITITKQNK